jgi:hypothetical protein
LQLISCYNIESNSIILNRRERPAKRVGKSYTDKGIHNWRWHMESSEEMWEKPDGMICPHPDFDRELYLSALRGEYICTNCGKYFTRLQKGKIERARQREQSMDT